jgi:hypothetical protein
VSFLRALDPQGSLWPNQPVVVGSAAFIENDISLNVVNGRPALAFRAAGLLYVRAQDSQGSAWPPFQRLLEDDTAVAELPSLAVIAGFPCIAYENRTRDGLDLLVGLDANGASFGASLAVDAGGIDSVSLLDVGGKPAMAYNLSDEEDLRYRIAE